MKENTRQLFDYLKENPNAQMTAAELGDALGFTVKQVNAMFTFSIQNKGLGERIVDEIEDEDGNHKQVKYLVLNEDGMNFDPDAE